MAKVDSITPEILRELLSYDPDTGRLNWKPRGRERFSSDRAFKSFNSKFAGREALTSPNDLGYKRGNVLGVTVRAHRAGWAIYYGEWPNGFIDHVNGDTSDNRMANLRIATQTQNMWNTRPTKNCKSKLKGVHFCKTTNRWRSKIRLDGKHIHLGRFDTEEAAHAAYCEAAKRYHGEFARTA